MNGNGTPRRGGRPLPRVVGWLGFALAFILIWVTVAALTGCGPCTDHGGVMNDNKGTFTCADGTVE